MSAVDHFGPEREHDCAVYLCGLNIGMRRAIDRPSNRQVVTPAYDLLLTSTSSPSLNNSRIVPFSDALFVTHKSLWNR
jgi:hypothetical protein